MDWIPLWMLEHLMKDIYGGDQSLCSEGPEGDILGFVSLCPVKAARDNVCRDSVRQTHELTYVTGSTNIRSYL